MAKVIRSGGQEEAALIIEGVEGQTSALVLARIGPDGELIEVVDSEGNPSTDNGGSQTAIKVVPVSFDATDTATDAVLLYTPDSGELVVGVQIQSYVRPDTVAIGIGALGVKELAGVQSGSGDPNDLFHDPEGVPTTGPIYGGIMESSGFGVSTAWVPNFNYEVDGTPPADVIEAGQVWYNSASAGISGAVEPDFAGGTPPLADGADIEWYVQDVIPTTGSITALIWVATGLS